MIKVVHEGDPPEVVLAKYEEATKRATELEAPFTAAAIQLHRFMVDNIEVDTGRTRNSLFFTVQGASNSIVATIGSNVSYAPYVRDKSHDKQFVKDAAQKELPGVLQALGENVSAHVLEGFA